MNPPEWLNAQEAADRIGVNLSTLYRLCQARKIRHRRIGVGVGKILFTPEDITSYLATCVIEVGEAPEATPQTLPTTLRYLKPQNSRRA